MRQLAILVLVLVAAATANAATINCTALPVPTNNFYNPPTACANDTAIAACITAYSTCVASTTSCSTGMSCVAAKLRCYEKAVPTASACSTWSAMFSNEKLYLAAGGDYNGSTLELSCRNAICDYQKAKPSVTCTDGDYNAICVDMVAATPAPTTTAAPPSTVPPAGSTVVTFTINGDKQKFDILLNTTEGRKQAYALVLKILMTILNVTDSSKIVIINIKTGSLVIDFYTTDPSLDVATVSSKIAAAKSGNQAALFGDLAAAAGIPVADLSVGDFTVTQATPAPQTPGGTPTPLTTSASGLATAAAVLAALLALLL